MQNRKAFTLVELSIVLVILGLLIGGVLTGQSLIRAAELRSISTQQARYITAVQTFRDKYVALPGDMTNATSYWGAADGSTGLTTACATTASSTATTCNGDGDGKILGSSPSNEAFRFWQHLANAGLIEGSYDGITHGSTTYSATLLNAPPGKLSSSLWFAYYWGTTTGGTQRFDGQYDNVLVFGGPIASSYPYGTILKPEEAYNIDTKTDDGKPATGRLVAASTMTGTATSCTDAANNTAYSANYLLTNATLSCALIFRQAF